MHDIDPREHHWVISYPIKEEPHTRTNKQTCSSGEKPNVIAVTIRRPKLYAITLLDIASIERRTADGRSTTHGGTGTRKGEQQKVHSCYDKRWQQKRKHSLRAGLRKPRRPKIEKCPGAPNWSRQAKIQDNIKSRYQDRDFWRVR